MSFIIKCPKNGHACINFACQNGSAINCQWQQISASTNVMSKTRESGFYFIKSKWDERFEPAEWSLPAECWALIGEERLFKDSDFKEIDERRIVREEPIKPTALKS